MTRKRRTARLLSLAVPVLLAPVAVLGSVGAGLQTAPGDSHPSPVARSDIPPTMLTVYQHGSAWCPGLSWTVLAGLGKVESNHDRPPAQTSTAGAIGLMQFLPTTFAAYGVDADGDGRADPHAPADAAAAAAHYLCTLGARTDVRQALARYTCGNLLPCQQRALRGYVTRVLSWAREYADPGGGSPTGTLAVQAALSQIGTPYQWGGETPAGFDCSGLTQFSYAAAGLQLPRTAQQQYDAGPLLPTGTAAEAGDLVFFGSPQHITHVGLALGQGRMVDAPHTGAVVRVEPIRGFGRYVGTTRPGKGGRS